MANDEPIKDSGDILIEELEKRHKQSQVGNSAMQDLYLATIQDIISKIREGYYAAHDNELQDDLKRVGFHDLARQVLRS